MVNIRDYQANPVDEPIKAIFEEQRGLMDKYHEIEEKTTGIVVPMAPLNLNLMSHQLRLKDFAWRISEEMGEALEAFGHKEHFDEELSDALHFLTELSILSGYNLDRRQYTLEHLYKLAEISWGPSKTSFRERNLNALTYRVGVVLMHLARTMNCLKNKPWKQTQMMTDVPYYNSCLADTWNAFIQLCITAGISPTGLYSLYARKRQVNQFRQGSQY